MKRRNTLAITLLGLILTSFAVAPRPTLAGNYSAATANDLVAAITSANADPASDTILLTADITLSTLAETTTEYGASGLPAVTTAIIIDGQGYSIARAANSPDFRIMRVAATGTLALYNLTISGGKGTVGTCYSGNICGSGLYSAGTLTLTHTTVTANTAAVGNGLFEESGSVNIYDSTFSNNSSIGIGGAIFVHKGSLNIEDSVIANNSATGSGGGIYVDQGSETIHHTAFSGNTTSGRGGGIVSYGTGTTITNSTFVNNSASQGGGIGLLGNSHISDSTFSGNTAIHTSDTPISAGGGAWFEIFYGSIVLDNLTFVGNHADLAGGIFYHPGSSLSINNSIIVQSTNGGNCGVEAQTLQSVSAADLADEASCPGFTDLSNPSQNLNIGSLADNGGNTKTYAINAPSPALDSATGSCEGFDQRGIARGINTSGAVNAPQSGDCDVGAFEAGGVIHTLQFASAGSSATAGASSYAIPITLDSALDQSDIRAYVWVSGGTAVAGVDYVPFGVQTVHFTPGNVTASAVITALHPPSSNDKTIILSFATQNGPGFSGPASLGTRLTYTVTLKVSGDKAAPTRNYFTTRTPTLSWNRSSQAVRYEIQAATTNVFGNTPIYDAGNRLSFTWPILLANATYFWHVRACIGATEATCGTWSLLDTFTVYVP